MVDRELEVGMLGRVDLVDIPLEGRLFDIRGIRLLNLPGAEVEGVCRWGGSYLSLDLGIFEFHLVITWCSCFVAISSYHRENFRPANKQLP